MAIEATSPTVISATFDKWAFIFRTDGFGVADPGQAAAGKVSATATLAKFRVREDGISERSPLPSDVVTVSVDDLYALAETDPVVAAAIAAIIEAVQHIGQSQGKL